MPCYLAEKRFKRVLRQNVSPLVDDEWVRAASCRAHLLCRYANAADLASLSALFMTFFENSAKFCSPPHIVVLASRGRLLADGIRRFSSV